MQCNSGLQDQLLGIAVAQERPDLEELKNQLIVNNAQMKAELKEIEDKILYKLSTSEGSPVDDIDLIHTLEASKLTSTEITVRTGRITYVCSFDMSRYLRELKHVLCTRTPSAMCSSRRKKYGLTTYE